MKRILISIALFLSITTKASTSNDAPLILEYNYADTDGLANFKSDPEFCCYFEIKQNKTITDTEVIKVLDKHTNTCLGVIYGKPTKAFLMMLYRNYLTPDKVSDITLDKQ